MPYNPSRKVRDAEAYAKKHGFNKVVVIGIDEAGGTMNGASYGSTAAECHEAKELMDAAYNAVYRKLQEAANSNP